MIAKLANYFRETARKIHSEFSRKHKEEVPEVTMPVPTFSLTGIFIEEIIKCFAKRIASGFGIPLRILLKRAKKSNQRKRAKAKARQLMKRGYYNRVKQTLSL